MRKSTILTMILVILSVTGCFGKNDTVTTNLNTTASTSATIVRETNIATAVDADKIGISNTAPTDIIEYTTTDVINETDNVSVDIIEDDMNDETMEEADDMFTAGQNDIIINSGSKWFLKGILTLPEGQGPFPTVVIVPASGRLTRYTYIDMMDYLVKRGIAAISFDKRSIAHIETLTDTYYTIREDCLDDALAAVALAGTIKKLDRDRIFVLGHSLGGYIIPQMNEEDFENIIAGYISMASGAMNMIESLPMDAELVEVFNPEMTEEEAASRRKEILEAYEDIKNLTSEDYGRADRIYGYYPAWWLEMSGYDPMESAGRIEEPILFMQGTHDLGEIIDTENLNKWRLATKNNPKAIYKLYPGLNHFFTETESIGERKSYFSMDEEVLSDIADFLNKNPS